jgi:hypothetical protein
MERFVSGTVRRLGALAATTLVGLTAAVAIGTPAHAIPDCLFIHSYTVDSNRNIHGSHLWSCEDEDILLSVVIKRYVSPGVYTTVASGLGSATYTCHGNALNIYKVDNFPDFFNTCT